MIKHSYCIQSWTPLGFTQQTLHECHEASALQAFDDTFHRPDVLYAALFKFSKETKLWSHALTWEASE